jgi:hypothetical protein
VRKWECRVLRDEFEDVLGVVSSDEGGFIWGGVGKDLAKFFGVARDGELKVVGKGR